MKPKVLLELLRDAFREWYADNTFQLGAALAYYAVFSLAPILIISLAVASLVFGEEAARGHITAELSATIGPRFASAVEDTLKHTTETGSGRLATLLSVAILLFTATAVFGQLQQALNTVWGVQSRSDRPWLAIIKDRFWSFTAVLGVGFLLLVSLVISTALSALSSFLTDSTLPGGIYLWRGIDWLISLGLITLLFAMIYKLLPDVEIAWRDVWIGAAVTAILFSLGKHLIGFYLGNSSWISAYGAAGSLVVILLWVFYSSQIFLFGAEFTQVYKQIRPAFGCRGSRRAGHGGGASPPGHDRGQTLWRQGFTERYRPPTSSSARPGGALTTPEFLRRSSVLAALLRQRSGPKFRTAPGPCRAGH